MVSVDSITPMHGMSHGTHLTVKTATETISVHLGPAGYLDNQTLKIKPSDRIEIKGSRTSMMGQPAIIAAEVKKGNQVLKLRDQKGVPVWSRQQQR